MFIVVLKSHCKREQWGVSPRLALDTQWLGDVRTRSVDPPYTQTHTGLKETYDLSFLTFIHNMEGSYNASPLPPSPLSSLPLFLISYTVEPLKRGQHGDKPFVLSREVVLFRRLLFLTLKMKHFSCLDTNTTECNQLSHESVEYSFGRGYHAYCAKMVSC